MSFLGKKLVAVILSCCGILCVANDLDSVIGKVSNWINTNTDDEFVKQNRKDDLKGIITSSKSDTEKIYKIKERFPKAFNDKSVIYLPPVSWEVHSLKLGYDIQESRTSETVEKSIISSTQTHTETNTVKNTDSTSSTHTSEAGLSANGSANISMNPFGWAGTLSVNAHASYNYKRISAHRTDNIWSKENQEQLAREIKSLTQTISTTAIRNLHLTFTMTITNNGEEAVMVDLATATIPIYCNSQAANTPAKRHKNMPDKIRISPHASKDVIFRMNLDTTPGRELVQFMTKNSPDINIFRGNLPITTESGKNINDEISNPPETVTVKLNIPQQSFAWHIRRNHTSSGKAVTLREALLEINKMFGSKKDLFMFTSAPDALSRVSDIELGTMFKDRYLILVEINKEMHTNVTGELLDKDIAETDVWCIDLEERDDIPDSLKKHVFDRTKIFADRGLFKSGNAYAQYYLADMYRGGFGCKKDVSEAAKWFTKAAEQGYAKAQCLLGVCFYRGVGVDQDYKIAVKWFTKAAEQGYAKAQTELGGCYYQGHGVDQDRKTAVKWFTQAAEQGDAEAQCLLGGCYYQGHGVDQDRKTAVKWFTKAAEQGDAEAQCLLGVCYYHGHGVDQDYTTAVKWFTKAVEQGDAKAQCWLGGCYYLGHGVDQDYTTAVKWFTKAAEQGDAKAQCWLGICYYSGKGVNIDYATAVKWFTKAAEQGDAEAAYLLGDYYYGNGVGKDRVTAVKWFTQAAEQGYAKAQNRLGECYLWEKGVLRNTSLAVKYFTMAAEQNDRDAEYYLGYCYEHGIGVKENHEKAKFYYSRAAEKGHQHAKTNLRNLQ